MGSIISFTGLTSANSSVNLNHSHSITVSESSGVVTITLGSAAMTTSSDRIANFNIADTAYFINAVSAAQSTGYRNAANAVSFPNSGTQTSMTVTYPNTSGGTSQLGFYITEGSWSSGKKVISLRRQKDTGAIVAQKTVNMPASGTWNVESRTGHQYGIPISATFKAGGKTYNYTGEI